MNLMNPINPITRKAILHKYVKMKPIKAETTRSPTFQQKVLISPHGIGIATLAQALREHGVHAASCSLYHDVYSYLSDICLNLNRHPSMSTRAAIRDAFLQEVLEDYELFHFRFGATFMGDKRDLKMMADLGKKMVVHHCGDEVRTMSIARTLNPYMQRREAWTEERIQNNISILSKYIEHVIINDHELLPYVEDYFENVHIVPYAFDARQIQPVYPLAKTVPLIVHAPSHRNVKGTRYVIEAVQRLQKEGKKFNFRLVEKMPHQQAMRLIQQSTIVIDQLTVGTYANLSMEAMAMGKPVICYIRDDLRHTFPSDLPIVSANPDTIYEVLRDLLDRPNDWGTLGIQGRRYMEHQHSYAKVAPLLIEVYKQL